MTPTKKPTIDEIIYRGLNARQDYYLGRNRPVMAGDDWWNHGIGVVQRMRAYTSHEVIRALRSIGYPVDYAQRLILAT